MGVTVHQDSWFGIPQGKVKINFGDVSVNLSEAVYEQLVCEIIRKNEKDLKALSAKSDILTENFKRLDATAEKLRDLVYECHDGFCMMRSEVSVETVAEVLTDINDLMGLEM